MPRSAAPQPPSDGDTAPRKLKDRRITRPAFDGVALRAMALGDLANILRWLASPHVTAHWGAHAALPEIAGHLDAADVSPFIIVAAGKPVGYLQVCAANDDPYWAEHDLPRVTFGLDLFVGEREALRRGLGSRALALAAAHLLDLPGVARVHGDPGPDNKAALRTFAKAGFEARGEIATPDGPAMYMAMDRR